MGGIGPDGGAKGVLGRWVCGMGGTKPIVYAGNRVEVWGYIHTTDRGTAKAEGFDPLCPSDGLLSIRQN